MSIKYQIIGLKALEWYNSWSQDGQMPYFNRAMDIYNSLETAIVNSCIPSKYKQNLITKEQADKESIDNTYQEYKGFRRSQPLAPLKKQATSERTSIISQKSTVAQKPKTKDNQNRTDLYIIEHEDLPEQKLNNSVVLNTFKKVKSLVWPLQQQTISDENEEKNKQIELDKIVKCKCLILLLFINLLLIVQKIWTNSKIRSTRLSTSSISSHSSPTWTGYLQP